MSYEIKSSFIRKKMEEAGGENKYVDDLILIERFLLEKLPDWTRGYVTRSIQDHYEEECGIIYKELK